MPSVKALTLTLLAAGPFLPLAACTASNPVTDAGFSQSGAASYPRRMPQGTVSVTTVAP